MGTISGYFTPLATKVFIVFSLIFTVSAMHNNVSAQSIVGKWERNTLKLFTLDKASGKQVPVSPEVQQQYNDAITKNGYKEILEMKMDNTYTSTVTTTGAAPRSREGKYTLSGNNLDMNIPLVKGEKTTITIHLLTNKEMVWDLEFMGKLTEVFYTRN